MMRRRSTAIRPLKSARLRTIGDFAEQKRDLQDALLRDWNETFDQIYSALGPRGRGLLRDMQEDSPGFGKSTTLDETRSRFWAEWSEIEDMFVGKIPQTEEEWRDVYDKVELPHATRDYGYNPNRDYEVDYLNGLLNEHGISVFRINPNNPEHQRRYRRHLEEPNGFHTVEETDI